MIHSPSKRAPAAPAIKIAAPKLVKIAHPDARFRYAAVWVILIGLVLIGRLALLMIVQHESYKQLAFDSQEISSKIVPKRGEIFLQDTRNGEKFPLAINKDYYQMFADTRQIGSYEIASSVTKILGDLFVYDDEKKAKVFEQLSKRTDPYEPLEQKVDEILMIKIKEMKLDGIHFTPKPYRFYPEIELAAPIIGFVGKDEKGNDRGRYGIEGYWNKELSGESGFIEGSKSAGGGLIALSGLKIQDSKDGANIILTIDRTLEFEACKQLEAGMQEHKASSAALIIMDPMTGAIRAMCSYPGFNPNEYGKIDSTESYNNTAIFRSYEPGSIFKPIAMGAALNEGRVNPETHFFDKGFNDEVCARPIRNAENKSYNNTNMIGILEDSINTGMIFVAEQLGTKKFREYVERFGFGAKTGIELDTESAGVIESLDKNKKEKIDCYTATGSFGQGLTVTPLQMVTAYAAIANGGHLMKPYIVDKREYADGRVEQTTPMVVREVLTKKSAELLAGMLVNVVENGHAKRTKSEQYYIGGKTGTAQIPGPGGYSEDTIHSFVGFGPVGDPKYVMIVKYEKPDKKYAESTAVPVFAKISKFMLDYYQATPNKR